MQGNLYYYPGAPVMAFACCIAAVL